MSHRLISRVAELRASGEEARARKLLDAINQVSVAICGKAHPMPEPVRSFEGLVTADASLVTPAEFVRGLRSGDLGLTTCVGDPLKRRAA